MINKSTKIDFTQKMQKLREESDKNKMTKEIPNDQVLCPFQSTPECEMACTPKCAIYRRSAKSHLYACPLTEIGSMAWNLKDMNDRSRGGAQSYQKRY